MNKESLDTGDIILFRGTGIIATVLEYFGKSKYSHVGIILKNPKFLNDNLEDGVYILESSYNDTPDAEDHKMKLGVQIHKLEDVVKEFPKDGIYIRKVNCVRDDSFYKKLSDIHKKIHNKPYDLNIFDWISAEYNLNKEISPNPLYKHTNKFWCSALASYIFYELGLIKDDINWSLIAPREFSSVDGKYLTFLCNVDVEKIYKE